MYPESSNQPLKLSPLLSNLALYIKSKLEKVEITIFDNLNTICNPKRLKHPLITQFRRTSTLLNYDIYD